MADVDPRPGLGNQPKDEWPSVPASAETDKPITRLDQDSELHQRTLNYLLARLQLAELEMAKFYDRWRVNEMKVQAYINLPDYEQSLKEATNTGEPPKVTSVVIPYSFATIATIVTYLIHTFGGRKPMFQVGTYKAEMSEAAGYMETKLQYDADHTRLIKKLFQFFTDGEVYGVGVLRTRWENKKALRTVWKTRPTLMSFIGVSSGGEKYQVRENRTVYQGNEVENIDPFMFFPDPRVPMVDVNRRGEFVFWRCFEGKHQLLADEAAGNYLGVKKASPLNRAGHNGSDFAGQSNRSLLSAGDPHPGNAANSQTSVQNYYQVDQGSVEIIPAELGLGSSTVPEKWIFTILNKNRIVQAERLDLDHGMHPISVIEPYTLGYGFGNAGLNDYLGPMQDTISWFINSHIHNVRSALNNMFVVDPSMVEMQDLTKPGAGKVIRLKRAAYGQDVRAALQQLGVTDVTSAHVRDVENFMRMGDALSSITDNIRGMQDSGGRKTATEVRTSGEAAASRLAAHTRLISAQGMTDLAEQLSLNNQQFLTEEFFLQVVGQDGSKAPIRIGPEQVVGDFYFPVHDGTLPIDRVAMLDVWKEIFIAVAQDQELRQQYNVPKIFEFIAELGGARNIESFKINVQPNDQMARAVEMGNAVPMGQAPGQTPGVVSNPGERMAGDL